MILAHAIVLKGLTAPDYVVTVLRPQSTRCVCRSVTHVIK